MTPTAKPSPSSESSSTRSLGDRLVKASAAIFVAHLVAKVMGLIQASVIGSYYGLGQVNDVFGFAFSGVIWSLYLVGEESLGPAFLPVFLECRKEDVEKAAWRFASIILNLQILLVLAVIVLLMCFPYQTITWVTQFNPGEESKVAELNRYELAARFLVWMAPGLFGLSIGSLTYMILNGYKRFFWPAFADAALKMALVACVILGRQAGLKEDALIAGVLAAGVTKLAVHLFALRDKLDLYQLSMDLRNPHFRKLCILIAPMLVGIVYAKLRDYYNDVYVISALETGLLSANLYGKKIYNTLGFLVPYSVSIALFPFLCEMVDRDDLTAVSALLTKAIRMLLMVFFPITVVLMLLSTPLAQILFQAGKVTQQDAALVGQINACYILVLPFAAVECIVMQAYFSTRRTIAVTLVGMVFSTLSMAISYFGVQVYGLRGAEAVMLIALGFTLSRSLKNFALVGVLKATGLPILPMGETWLFLIRVSVLTLVCAGSVYGTQKAIDLVLPETLAVAGKEKEQEIERETKPPSGEKTAPSEFSSEQKTQQADRRQPSRMKILLRVAPRFVFPGLIALAIFVLGCRLLRFGEFDEMIAFARQKMKRKRGKKEPESKESPDP